MADTAPSHRPLPTSPTVAEDGPGLPYDFYREIHKGIRYAIFHTIIAAGSLDANDDDARKRFVAGHRALLDLLHLHHHHEDEFVQPLVLRHAPELAIVVTTQHGDIEAGMARLGLLAAELAVVDPRGRASLANELYLDLSRFASVYLTHQLVEETEVMPTLRATVPTDELLALDMAIRMSVPPPVMEVAMASMLPAMNPDERVDMLGGMSLAPPEIFAGFCAAAQGALTSAEWSQITGRLALP